MAGPKPRATGLRVRAHGLRRPRLEPPAAVGTFGSAHRRGAGVNAFLIGTWALTGMGYFWPAWILAGWGVGMLLGLRDYWRGPVTEADVDEELRRMHR